MILKWFDSVDAQDFGRLLAADIAAIFRHRSSKPQAPGKLEVKAMKALDTVLAKADMYKLKQHPNFYQKAKILNTLKWELREAGFDDEIIDQFIAALAVRL